MEARAALGMSCRLVASRCAAAGALGKRVWPPRVCDTHRLHFAAPTACPSDADGVARTMRGMGEPKELQAGGRHLSALSKTPKLARPPSRHRSTDRCILTAGGSSCGDLSKPVATGQALAGPLGGFMSELHSYTHEGRTIYQWEQSVGCVSFKIAVLAALSTFSGVLGLVGAIHRRAVDRTQRPAARSSPAPPPNPTADSAARAPACPLPLAARSTSTSRCPPACPPSSWPSSSSRST